MNKKSFPLNSNYQYVSHLRYQKLGFKISVHSPPLPPQKNGKAFEEVLFRVYKGIFK